MGVILIVALLVGIVCGLVLSLVLGFIAAFATRKQSKHRRHVWPAFGIGMAALVPVLAIVFHAYPLPEIRAGSDYDIAFKNLFISGLCYAAIPGCAAILALVATFVLPKKQSPIKPTPVPSKGA